MTLIGLLRPSPRALATLGTAILVAGCGGATPSVSAPASPGTHMPTELPSPSASVLATSTPQPTAISTATPTPTPARDVAGEIDRVATQEAYVDDELAADRDRLFERSSITTNESGSLQFNLIDKIDVCTMVQNSRVDIKPSGDRLLDFVEGTAVCLTRPDDDIIHLGAGSDAELRMSDPAFLVTVADDATIVRVLTGVVEVRNPDTDRAALLGPMLRSDVFAGGDIGDPQGWGTGELQNDLVLAAVNDLENRPGPDLSMPDPGNSATLNRIAENRTIVLGIPEALAAADQDVNFVTGYLIEHTVNWKVGEHQRLVIEPPDAADALAEGTIDVFVAPERIDGLGQIPLFENPAGQRFWLHYDPSDEGFGAAERTYLRNLIIDGGYRIGYLRAFDAEASYGFLADLLGLN